MPGGSIEIPRRLITAGSGPTRGRELMGPAPASAKNTAEVTRSWQCVCETVQHALCLLLEGRHIILHELHLNINHKHNDVHNFHLHYVHLDHIEFYDVDEHILDFHDKCSDAHDLNIILDHDIFNDRDKDHIDILVSDENNINIIIHHDHDNIKDRNINNHFVRDQDNDDNLHKVNNVDLHYEYFGNFHEYFYYIHHQHLQQFNDLLEHHDIQYIHYIYEHNCFSSDCNIHNNLVDEFDLHYVHLDINYIHHDELHHIHNYHIQYDHNDDDHLPGTEELELRLLRFDSLPVGDNVTTSNASLVPADTSLQQYTHIMFFIESSFCEQTTPQVIPVLDAKASVSSVAFVDKDLDGWEIGGSISWYYRLYLADDDIGVNRALLNYQVSSFRYLRFTVLALRNDTFATGVQIADIEFRVAGATLGLTGALASNEGSLASLSAPLPVFAGPSEAIDGSAATKWFDYQRAPLVVKLPSAQLVEA
ncbi:unnamed protein product [Symbiodinium microadriaticum]|nr:unnamed protein product [Symbiodinium microadriaticum]